MTRCTLALLLALGLLVEPLAAEAQQPTRVHRIGVLLGTTPGKDPFVGAFLEGMCALGYVEGQNLVIEYRGAEGQHERFPDLVDQSRLPALYWDRVFVEAGGLLAYGANQAAMWRRAATYVDKILNGAKPGDLPVEQPTTFELVINLKTTKDLGLTIPPTLLLQADEVIC